MNAMFAERRVGVSAAKRFLVLPPRDSEWFRPIGRWYVAGERCAGAVVGLSGAASAVAVSDNHSYLGLLGTAPFNYTQSGTVAMVHGYANTASSIHSFRRLARRQVVRKHWA